ncbi:hypothetical protein PAXRUDRAFT_828389 [Paxillus rubicundulus Ve08.2h10]|uniref:Uncharacterized protein n=1 Tax=Paxillus rubicundulus Ve08.2h10 TaxID=930991 RepID=A0A0D0DPS9_9AGAM|nr:hypothetical protein PAXRUDRAFT_828389 [Paxillus rubicundulus Ve08.2h10]
MSSTHPHHHSLEGNNPLRGTDYLERAPAANHGIVDGRPEGRQPKGSPVLLDTLVDNDASMDNEGDYLTATSTFSGATSHDVHGGLGMPVQGMSSKELRHDGQPGRKRHGQGTEQFGEGAGGDRLSRDTRLQRGV